MVVGAAVKGRWEMMFVFATAFFLYFTFLLEGRRKMQMSSAVLSFFLGNTQAGL